MYNFTETKTCTPFTVTAILLPINHEFMIQDITPRWEISFHHLTMLYKKWILKLLFQFEPQVNFSLHFNFLMMALMFSDYSKTDQGINRFCSQLLKSELQSHGGCSLTLLVLYNYQDKINLSFILRIFLKNHLLYVYECFVCMYICITMSGDHGSQKLELQTDGCKSPRRY